MSSSFASSSPAKLSLLARLGGLTDGASLAAFRFVFGALMFTEVSGLLGGGWVKEYYVDPGFHFSFFAFSWVTPWPGAWMYVHFVLLSACAAAVALGWHFRIASTLFTIGFAYVFLIEKAYYLNHFYAIILFSAILSVTPAHHLWSLDARAGRVKPQDYLPIWPVYLLRAQILILYIYAGIAKLNADWLSAEPLRHWLGKYEDLPWVGGLIASETSYYLASYAGLILDLLVAPLLLFPRTRLPALLAFATFHLSNSLLFSIGVFPFMMLGANLLFLPTDYPRKLPRWLRVFVPLDNLKTQSKPSDFQVRPLTRFGFAILSAYLVSQIAVPLRHHLYPGDVAWTEEGHRFSWRMKLRDKSGRTRFYAQQPSESQPERVNIRPMLTKMQRRKMRCQPDMILEFSRHLGARLKKEGQASPQIFVKADCSVNFHPKGRLIDASVNLAAEEDSFLPLSWLLPRPN